MMIKSKHFLEVTTVREWGGGWRGENKCDHMSSGSTSMTSQRWLTCFSLQICNLRCFSSSPFCSLMHSSPSSQLIRTNPPFRRAPKLRTRHTRFSYDPTTFPFSTLKKRCVKGWQMQTATSSSPSESAGPGAGAGSSPYPSALTSFQMSYSAMWLELQGQQLISLRVLLSGILILWVWRQFLVLRLQRMRGSLRQCGQPCALILCSDLQRMSSSSSFISKMLPMNTDPFSCAISEIVWCRSSRKEAQTLEAKLEAQMLFSYSITSFVRGFRRRRYRLRPCLYASHYYYQEQQIPINIIKINLSTHPPYNNPITVKPQTANAWNFLVRDASSQDSGL